MIEQLKIDFTQVVHSRENNPQSEAHLKVNKVHFTKQCILVLSIMQNGEKLTCREALIKYGVGHLPRRIGDLRKAGIDVKGDFLYDKNGKRTRFMEYYINLQS